MTHDLGYAHRTHRLATYSRFQLKRIAITTVLTLLASLALLPATASAESDPHIWIDRVDSKFVIQGLNFPGGQEGYVSAGIGETSGGKTFWVQNHGYLWVEFYSYADKCGDAWATVEVNGVERKAWKSFACPGDTSTNTDMSAASSTPTPAPDPAPATTATATPAPASAPEATSTDPAGWRLVNSDNFDGTSLDESKWGIYEGSGNAGVGYRKREAISVSDGELRITGRGDISGGVALNSTYTSGRFEVRARTDKGAGYGPAALLWPTEQWPVNGEIDISEVPKGDRMMSGSYLHWGADNHVIGHEEYADHSQWHTYAVEWEPSKITFFLDGKVIWTVTQPEAIPSSGHFLALQLDIGDGGFIESRNSSTPAEVTYHVDSVNVYQRP